MPNNAAYARAEAQVDNGDWLGSIRFFFLWDGQAKALRWSKTSPYTCVVAKPSRRHPSTPSKPA